MNPLRLLKFLALPALALSAASPAAGLTKEEFKHVQGDPAVTNIVTFDVTVYKSEYKFEEYGQLKFALFGELLPVSVNNFLSTVDMQTGGYTDSTVHRIVKDAIIQGGYLRKVGYKKYVELEYEKFKQENFDIFHNKVGRLSLASTGGDTNGISYFVTTKEAMSFFDGKYVCIGQLVSGFDVLKKLNDIPVDGENPLYEIVITRAQVSQGALTPYVELLGNVTKEYLVFIWVTIGLVVAFVLYRVRRRRSLIDLKTYKM